MFTKFLVFCKEAVVAAGALVGFVLMIAAYCALYYLAVLFPFYP